MEQSTKPVFNETRRNVAGIDLAWRADHYVCGPRMADGNHEIASFDTTTAGLHKMLRWLQHRDVESVAMESTSVYWIPVADLLEANGIEVVLVDPREVRMVPGRKSDVKDCQWLQKLHSCGLLRGAFRPPEDVTAIRTILREKESLIRMRTKTMQHMQKSLDQMNIRVHHAVSDINGVTGVAIIKAIVGGERDPFKLAMNRDKRCKKSVKEIAEHLTGTWREEHLFNLKQAFKTFQCLEEGIAEYEAKIIEMYKALADKMRGPDDEPPLSKSEMKELTAKERKNYSEKRVIERITKFDMTTLPGIDFWTAAVIISEIGTKIDSFPSERHFASYIGLAPSLGKSAGKNVRQKKRCKNTSRVGRALRMAASSLWHCDSALGAYYRDIARRSDAKTAIFATARRMAHMIYRGLRYGVEYVDRGVQAYEERLRTKSLNTIKKLIKLHNINILELENAVV